MASLPAACCSGRTAAVAAAAPPAGAAARSGGAWGPHRLTGSRPFRQLGGPPGGARNLRLRVATGPAVATKGEEAGDFYDVLGVNFTAAPEEIRRAYRRLAKEFHPDVSMSSLDDPDEATEFATFLNYVYETLMDEERRAQYDAIAGFALGGVNPFNDISYERDQAFVDEFSCIGCRNCANVCPSTFEMEDEYGRARVMRQGVDGVEKLQEAMDTCPVTCIHWVTSPQLALLEESMARMERVGAWLLRNTGGKAANLNVFVEASLAYERRQSLLRDRAQREAAADRWRAGWGAAGGAAMGKGPQQAAAGNGAAGGRRTNAANVAAAARRWRDYQRVRRNRAQSFLPELSSATATSSQGSSASLDG